MSLRRIAPFAVVASSLLVASVARADDPPATTTPPPATTAAPATGEAPPVTTPAAKPDLIPPEVDKSKDQTALEKQGDAKGKAEAKGYSGQVFADDWWSHTRPIVEIHGFFRTRAELFHNFALGRNDAPKDDAKLFPRPIGDSYVNTQGEFVKTEGCGPTAQPFTQGGNGLGSCEDKTHASANLRFRIDPEIHISDNLRIMSQIDFLDNLVMGSTPEGYVNTPNANGGYTSGGRGGYVPLKSFSTSQAPPTAGINSYTNSVVVKRVWAEFLTPIGQIRFGRMPNQWGLGILANAGDRIDSDYQSHADRILFATGSKALDLYVAAAWDFPNSGRTSQTLFDQQGQPYNVSQLENTHQWVLSVFRRMRPDIQKQKLAKGDVVINGGFWTVYRQQLFANESVDNSLSASPETFRGGLVRVGARALIPDFWLQILTKRLRWETEMVYIYGSIENPEGVANGVYKRDDYKVRQFGAATELEYKVLNDDLKLRFSSGFASGDQGVDSLAPGNSGLQLRRTSDKTVSTFRFHPDYRIDLILFRNILSRVQGAYYFKPGVEYDFTKALDGEKFGGRAEIIWSRASKAVQTPGHKEDLGIELDLTLYYQSRDGSLNDDPSKIGGFYAMLQYGVLFPLGGLGYMSEQKDTNTGKQFDVSSAQIVRLFMGVAY